MNNKYSIAKKEFAKYRHRYHYLLPKLDQLSPDEKKPITRLRVNLEQQHNNLDKKAEIETTSKENITKNGDSISTSNTAPVSVADNPESTNIIPDDNIRNNEKSVTIATTPTSSPEDVSAKQEDTKCILVPELQDDAILKYPKLKDLKIQPKYKEYERIILAARYIITAPFLITILIPTFLVILFIRVLTYLLMLDDHQLSLRKLPSDTITAIKVRLFELYISGEHFKIRPSMFFHDIISFSATKPRQMGPIEKHMELCNHSLDLLRKYQS